MPYRTAEVAGADFRAPPPSDPGRTVVSDEREIGRCGVAGDVSALTITGLWPLVRLTLVEWDQYIDLHLDGVRALRDGMNDMRATLRAFDGLLDAAVATAEPGHMRQYVRTRDRYIHDVQAISDRIHAAMKRLDNSTVQDDLLELVNRDREARAIFEAARKRYAKGSLSEFTQDQ